MRLVCYLMHGTVPTIRPARAGRDWMDATPEAFAYRCLALDIANAHGWEILCPAGFEARWSGGAEPAAVTVDADGPAHLLPVSHFGSGILTFHVHGLIRTEPGVQLWVQGGPNHVKDGIFPLSAVVETDWAPYSFTMNWRFTRPGTVRFAKDEPFCFFFPIELDLIEQVQPEFRPLAAEPDLEAAYRAWAASRNGFNAGLQETGSAEQREKWQKAYFRGRLPDGSAGPGRHRTRLKVAGFAMGAPPAPEPPTPPPDAPPGQPVEPPPEVPPGRPIEDPPTTPPADVPPVEPPLELPPDTPAEAPPIAPPVEVPPPMQLRRS